MIEWGESVIDRLVKATPGPGTARVRVAQGKDTDALEFLTHRGLLSGHDRPVVDLWIDRSDRIRQLSLINEDAKRGRQAIHMVELWDFG